MECLLLFQDIAALLPTLTSQHIRRPILFGRRNSPPIYRKTSRHYHLGRYLYHGHLMTLKEQLSLQWKTALLSRTCAQNIRDEFMRTDSRLLLIFHLAFFRLHELVFPCAKVSLQLFFFNFIICFYTICLYFSIYFPISKRHSLEASYFQLLYLNAV